MQTVFQGYRRPDGQYGARNLVAVIPSVICANDVGQAICRQVQGTIGYFHHQGCCQLPIDLKRVTDVLSNLGQSPNVGAALIVSLGCEGTDHERMVEEIRACGKPVDIIRIQELGGTSRAIQAGIDAAQRMVMEISSCQREEVDASEIMMSIKCGASDATSGLASNAVIGYVADKLVDLGGTVIFGETTEFMGAEHIAARHAVDDATAEAIVGAVERMENRARAIGVDMRGGQPTRGNIEGGLTTIEEKSLGALAKAGSAVFQEVVPYGVPSKKQGLVMMDSPGREPELLTGLAAMGCTIVVFATGRGAPQGFPFMPVVKITGNARTWERMREHMDVYVGDVISGEKTNEAAALDVFEHVLAAASGEPTAAERTGYFRSMNIYTTGPVI